MNARFFPVNAALARILIPLFLRWKISANQVTVLSLLAGIAGGFCLIHGTPAGMFCGVTGFLLANLLDECDGSVARATGTSSGFGSWLDTLIGCNVHAIFFFSLGIGLSRATGQRAWFLMGVLAALGVIASTVIYVLTQRVVRGRGAWIHPDPPRSSAPGRFEFIKGMLRTDFSVIVLAAAIAGQLHWILWGGLVGPFLFWIPADLWVALQMKRSDSL